MDEIRAPNYELALLDYQSGMKYKDIAEKYGVTINSVKSWKTRYQWSKDKKKSVHTKSEKVCAQKGGQPGNKNAVGNKGGAAPEKKYGWKEEDGGWRFYKGDTGECVRNTWHQDQDGKMVMQPVKFTPGQDGALRYPGFKYFMDFNYFYFLLPNHTTLLKWVVKFVLYLLNCTQL